MKIVHFILLLISPAVLVAQDQINTIAFGSCSRQESDDQLWTEVLQAKPDLWIWLGDNIYADTEDMAVMKAKYDLQKGRETYQQLLKSTQVIGTWDDHDYGKNDAGKEYPMKTESKKLFLEFMDVPKDDPVWNHEGVYSAYDFGEGKKKVKVILLDTRSFRDSLKKSTEKNGLYIQNPDGDVLGEAQWRWLERELKNSKAMVHIIVSSIQFIPHEHKFEKWMNFPAARQRMISLLQKYAPRNTCIISGDRHFSEISEMEIDGWKSPLYDVTSSSLTSPWKNAQENNSLRVGQLVAERNFGILKIDWTKPKPTVDVEIRGKDNQLFLSERIIE